MHITLKIYRYNPEKDSGPHYDNFELDVEPTDRILDMLEEIKGYQDPTLSFRRSCAHGVCGSDAMRIDGHNALSCKTLFNTINKSEITVEPLLGLQVIKDLIVDMEPFYENYRSIMPYLINEEPFPEDGKERIQTQGQRARIDDTTKCILCAACTTSCPTFWADGKYVGPAAIVNAHRFIFDSRDRGAAERLAILNQRSGVWACRTIFNCTEACPRGIEVTRALAEVKNAIQTGKI